MQNNYFVCFHCCYYTSIYITSWNEFIEMNENYNTSLNTTWPTILQFAKFATTRTCTINRRRHWRRMRHRLSRSFLRHRYSNWYASRRHQSCSFIKLSVLLRCTQTLRGIYMCVCVCLLRSCYIQNSKQCGWGVRQYIMCTWSSIS